MKKLKEKTKSMTYKTVSQLSIRQGQHKNESPYQHLFPLYILVRRNGRRYQYLKLNPELCLEDEEMKENVAMKWLEFSEQVLKEFLPEILEKNKYAETAFMGLCPFEVILN